MARLPVPGSDANEWGKILNEFLLEAHKTNGQLQDDSITSSQLKTGSVTENVIAENAVTATALAPNSVDSSALALNAVDSNALAPGAVTEDTIADGAIPQSKIANLEDELSNKLVVDDLDSQTVSLMNDLDTETGTVIASIRGSAANGTIISPYHFRGPWSIEENMVYSQEFSGGTLPDGFSLLKSPAVLSARVATPNGNGTKPLNDWFSRS